MFKCTYVIIEYMINECYISENVDYLVYVTLHFRNGVTIFNSEI